VCPPGINKKHGAPAAEMIGRRVVRNLLYYSDLTERPGLSTSFLGQYLIFVLRLIILLLHGLRTFDQEDLLGREGYGKKGYTGCK
jgi:hypothetical protein